VGPRKLVGAAILAAALGCSDGGSFPAGPPDIERAVNSGVVAHVEDGLLTIENGTTAPIVVTVVETRFFYTAFALWCFGHDQCGTVVAPAESAQLPVAEINGYSTAALSAEVFWWTRGTQAARVNAIRVPLRTQ
jgi:hypothetical protein